MRILFLCVANSARSQIAEGLGRDLLKGIVDVCSAGSQPSKVNPIAIQVLQEIGVDISHQKSKSIEVIDKNTINLVITLCAEEICPLFSGNVQRLHWPLPDPVVMGRHTDQSKQIALFREIRDDLKRRIILLKTDILAHKI